LEFLADRVEGNLLAAHQEVQKLALLAPEGELSRQTVNEAVASVARYDPYVAAEALLADGLARYVRVIEGLRAEGEQPTFVLFVLSSVLFVLHGLARGARCRARAGPRRRRGEESRPRRHGEGHQVRREENSCRQQRRRRPGRQGRRRRRVHRPADADP